MKVTAEFQPLPNRKLIFTLRYDDVKQQSYTFDPNNLSKQKQVAKDCGITVQSLLAFCDETLTGVNPTVKSYVLSDTQESTDFEYYIRDLLAPRQKPTVVSDVREFLTQLRKVPRESIAEWTDKSKLACLDIDYHEGTQPNDEWIDTTVRTSLLPKPYLWHRTPRGVHAFYLPLDKLSADEVCALAALRWKSLDAAAGVEIKSVVRGPGVSPIYDTIGYAELASFVTDWLNQDSTVEESRIESYLESTGMEKGQRYAHDRCPIDPGGSTDNRNPVVVGDSGIYCYRCSALGRQVGRNKAGWVSWNHLTGSESSGIIGTLVRRQTHWGHAKHVLDAGLGIDKSVGKLAYRAAIKLYHDAPLLGGIFREETDTLVRMRGKWATVEEGYTFPKDIVPLLQTLPVTQYVSDDGKIKSDAARVSLLQQPVIDLKDWGYPEVSAIRGVRLSTRLLGSSRLIVSSPAPWLKEYGSVFYPRYVPIHVRMPEEEAWGVLESVFPGLNRTYIETLLVARGCNEAEVGLPQHMLVTGVSKSGKTAQVQIAAGILGDVCTSVPTTPDSDRFRASIRTASAQGSFLSMDEFIKDSVKANSKLSPEQVLDPILNMDPSGLSHELYVGPTPLGKVGVCVWTETSIPEVLRNHTQIARRVHYLRFKKQIASDWDTSLAANGISYLYLVRTISQQHSDACNAILSYVSDKYFKYVLTFHQYCSEILNVPTLEKSDEFIDPTEKLLDFFRLVCEAEELGPVDAVRWPGKGYKLITKDDSQLDDAWAMLANGAGAKDWGESRILLEKDWSKLLKVDDAVSIDLHRHQNRLAIRFRTGGPKSPKQVNQGITGHLGGVE